MAGPATRQAPRQVRGERIQRGARRTGRFPKRGAVVGQRTRAALGFGLILTLHLRGRRAGGGARVTADGRGFGGVSRSRTRTELRPHATLPRSGYALGDTPDHVRRPGAGPSGDRGDLRQLRASPNHRRRVAPAAQPQDRRGALPLRAVRLGRPADPWQAAPLAGSPCRSCAQAALDPSRGSSVEDALKTQKPAPDDSIVIRPEEKKAAWRCRTRPLGPPCSG